MLHEQYYLWGKAELLQKRGASKEEIKAVLNEAILLTKPFFGKKKNTSDLYSEMEIKLFFGADSVFGRYFMERGRIEKNAAFYKKV